MSKTIRRTALIIIILVAVYAGIALISRIVYYGRNHIEATIIAQHAGENWQNGDFIGAATEFITATRLTLEGGIRSMMAQPFVMKSSIMEQQGRLPEALDYCVKAVRILGRYDDEGSYDYRCMTLTFRIQNPKTPSQGVTPTSTVEP